MLQLEPVMEFTKGRDSSSVPPHMVSLFPCNIYNCWPQERYRIVSVSLIMCPPMKDTPKEDALAKKDRPKVLMYTHTT